MTPNKQLALISILLLLLLVLGSFLFVLGSEKEDKEYFNYNNVSVSESEYKAIQEQFKTSPQVRICNIEDKNCILLHKF